MNKKIIHTSIKVIAVSLITLLLYSCDKTFLIEPEVCFTTNRIDSLDNYVESDVFETGEAIYFVSCANAQMEVIYTGERKIAAELQKPDGTDSIVFSVNTYYPDKSSLHLNTFFDTKGKPLVIRGLPLALAGEQREVSYKYTEEGIYEVYIEAINTNEDGEKTKANLMKEITITKKE